MADYNGLVEEVAELMREFRLTKARYRQGELTIAFSRRATARNAPPAGVPEQDVPGGDTSDPYVLESPTAFAYDDPVESAHLEPVISKGLPISSPMTGIFYASPSPGSPPFLKVGEPISAGQVVGLIEAMKVFNEIPSPLTGTVLEIVAQSGQIVNPGDVLVYIG